MTTEERLDEMESSLAAVKRQNRRWKLAGMFSAPLERTHGGHGQEAIWGISSEES